MRVPNDWRNYRLKMSIASADLAKKREKLLKEQNGDKNKMDTNGNSTTKNPTFEIYENTTARFTLLQDKPKTGTSARGTWWLFSVEYKGEKQSFFAPKEVVEWIEKNNCKKGDEIEVTLTYDEIMPDVPNYKLVKVKDNTYKPSIPVEEKDQYFRIMELCMTQAEELQKLHPSFNCQNIATTMFIQRTKY